MRRLFSLLIVFAVGVVAAAQPPKPAQDTAKPRPTPTAPAPASMAVAPFRVEPLTSPAGADTGEPQLTVEGDRAILSWLETHEDHVTLKFAERTPAGWSEARTVISGSQLMVMPADVPSVRALSDGTLVAAWLEDNGGDGEAYDLLLASSKDSGRTWSKPTRPHHDGTKTQHGFPSLVTTPGGGFMVLWLDGRGQDPETGHGDMTLRAADYGADGVERREMVVDSRVCDCCPTSTAWTSEGLVATFRDRSPEEIRDISLARLTAGKWSAPVPVHRDGWKIEGCPVNGPAVRARGTTVAVAWFTGEGGGERAFAAFSSDAGRTFGAPIRLDEGRAFGRVQIALLKDGSAAASWIDFVEPRSLFRLIAEGIGSTHPKLVQVRDEILVTWVESSQGSTRVRVARVPVG